MNQIRGPYWLILILLGMISVGCGTTTTGTATEQMLISDAVDHAIGKIDFRAIAGKKVYLETDYYRTLKGSSFINAEYITSSLRQQLAASRCYLQEKREDAEIIVEPRVGALGTDGHEVIFGIPKTSSLSSAANALASVPLPTIPEISVGKVNAKSGIAKIIVFAYDRESREPIWQSGIAKAESTSKDTWMFGAGPFQKGTIHDGTKFAGKRIDPPQFEKIVFEQPFRSFDKLRQSSYQEEISDQSANALDINQKPPRQTVPLQNEFYFIDEAPRTAEADPSDQQPDPPAEQTEVK